MRTFRSIDTRSIRRQARQALKRARRGPRHRVEFRSRFGEDALIWTLCDYALDGFFVEVRARDGSQVSVAYALECLGWRGLRVEPPTTTALATTLNRLLAEHQGNIDAVSIDLEGAGIAALAGFDLPRHRPKVLLLGDDPRTTDEELEAHMATQPYSQVARLPSRRVYVRSDLVPVMAPRLAQLTERDAAADAGTEPAGKPDLKTWRALKAKIPGWFAFAGTYDRAVAKARDGAIFVEVGSWKGRSAYYMASRIKASGKRIRFHCVDHWLGSEEHRNDPDVIGGTLYDTFLRNVADVREFIEPMRMSSLDAAARFDDAACALVMIDASHGYDDVMADIAAWWPKVAAGGLLAGDDYEWPGVQRAVHELFGDRVEVVGEVSRRHWRIVK